MQHLGLEPVEHCETNVGAIAVAVHVNAKWALAEWGFDDADARLGEPRRIRTRPTPGHRKRLGPVKPSRRMGPRHTRGPLLYRPACPHVQSGSYRPRMHRER